MEAKIINWPFFVSVLNLNFGLPICVSFRTSIRQPVRQTIIFFPIPAVVSQNVTNESWHVLRVENM